MISCIKTKIESKELYMSIFRIISNMASLFPTLYTILHILNAALCQPPPPISKTKKAINYIKHFALLARFNNGNLEKGIHHITCISTNKSLEETKQWKLRAEKNLNGQNEGLNILVLSSKSKINNIDKIKSLFVNASNASKLPDVIIFCTHQKRINDMIELIDSLNNGNLDFRKIGIHQITSTIMFDEADANIGLIIDFLNQLNTILNDRNITVRDIHYITATPFKQFWKKLEEHGIKKLKNINEILKEADHDSDLHLSYVELMKEYRYINEHVINTSITSLINEPHKYVQICLKEIHKQRANGLREGPLTIFAPAKNDIKSHNKMKETFQYPGSNFCVLIHNGKEKKFWYPSGTFQTIEEFGEEQKFDTNDIELKDILVKWREVNPDMDLAITGNWTIQRGITFCTIGFNFTDLIISNYHLNNINALIQLLGRANGGKEYVQIMNIWCPLQVITEANEQIKRVNDLLASSPEEFNESQFRKKTKAEINEPAMTVPVIIELTDDEMTSIKKIGRQWNEKCIKELIGLKNQNLLNDIDNNNCQKDQITEPTEESAIRKQLEPLVNGAEHNKKSMTSVKKKNKNKNIYQVFIDKKSSPKRLIVSIFYGTRLDSQPIIDNELDDSSDESSDEE